MSPEYKRHTSLSSSRPGSSTSSLCEVEKESKASSSTKKRYYAFEPKRELPASSYGLPTICVSNFDEPDSGPTQIHPGPEDKETRGRSWWYSLRHAGSSSEGQSPPSSRRRARAASAKLTSRFKGRFGERTPVSTTDFNNEQDTTRSLYWHSNNSKVQIEPIEDDRQDSDTQHEADDGGEVADERGAMDGGVLSG